jgi:signal transduction histidine kinase
VLSVTNEGPPLPAGSETRLFDSMVSVRPAPAPGAAPHLGLGLFVVRQIAAFHGALARAQNRADREGVTASVTFPRA